MRSFLKWAGSKYSIREHILNALPEGKRLVEPFAGSCSIFLNSDYSEYLLAEKNPDLIDLYLLLQKEGKAFIDDCQEYFKPENNCREKYLAFRQRFNDTYDKPKQKRERAQLFVYLNRHGYNGLCRYNSKGGFNVPFGRYKQLILPVENMLFFHEKSQKAIFKYADFRDILKEVKKGDVVYCDPPYVALSKKAMQTIKYTSGEFCNQSQKDLAKFSEKLSKNGIPVILSNHDTPEIREYYKNAQITSLDVRRYISQDVTNRYKAAEIIAVFNPQ